MAQPTVISVQVKIVKACAAIKLNEERIILRGKLMRLAENIIEQTVRENNSWFRRFFNKQVSVPNATVLVEQWYLDVKNNILIPETEVWWAFLPVESAWWQRLKQLENLPDKFENDIMFLSIEDAMLIGLNINFSKVSQ